jgi:hypothetical protein
MAEAKWETEMSAQTLQIIGYFLAGWIFGGLALAAAHLVRSNRVRSPVRVRAERLPRR